MQNNPINAIDPLGLLTEVITFSPVGYGKSSFGHTALNINGSTYSFGEKGWFTENTVEYLKRNSFRDATGQELNLSEEQEALLLEVIKKDMAENQRWTSQFGYDGRGNRLSVTRAGAETLYVYDP